MADKLGEVKSKIDQVDRSNEWVKKQVREELIKLNKECFYEIDGGEVTYNMDTVKHYLNSIKDKKTWKELTMQNSSVLIMAVQMALYSQNYSFGRIDGLLGPKTKSAIKKFQADNGLPVDVYGRSMPSTIVKLLEKVGDSEKVELSESEKQEYLVLRPKDEDKSEDKPFTWDNASTSETPSWFPQQDKREVKVPYAPVENTQEKKEEIDENTIRPEVQSMVDNYRREVDRFSTLTYITLAEAKAIGGLAGGFLYLSGIKNLSEESFDALSKFKGGFELGITSLTPKMAKSLEGKNNSIYFKNVLSLSKETASALAKTYGKLSFDAIKNLPGDVANELANKYSGDLIFNGLPTLSVDVINAFKDYKGTVSFNGVTSITPETAKLLAEKNTGFFILKGIKAPLSEELLPILAKAKHVILDPSVIEQIHRYSHPELYK